MKSKEEILGRLHGLRISRLPTNSLETDARIDAGIKTLEWVLK